MSGPQKFRERHVAVLQVQERGVPELRGTEFPLGVATARQLVAIGFSERTVYKRCQPGGPWRRLLPGVIGLFSGTPTRDQYVLAALLGRNGETRFRNATFLSCKFMNVAFLNFHRAHGGGVGGADPTMWGAGVTAWDGPCHTHGVPHLCVIIIDERVG